jgi:DNA-binding NarL/FixJ family response regulator
MYEPLTKREKEVLELMFRGRNQEEIADQLCIAPATVNKHRQHIYERLGVHNERDALLAAYHIGILSLLDNLTEQENKKVKY